MHFKFRNFIFPALAIALGLTFAACKKISSTAVDPALTQTLSDALADNPGLSKFTEFVRKTGVDVMLQSSKTFSVWAPTNDALASLDPAIVADTAKLRAFVLNHISGQAYYTRDVQTYIRVPMLSGKYNNFFGSKIEDANITTADKYVMNGVLYVIDKPLLVLPNVWDFINSTTTTYSQNAFIAGLNFLFFNPALATVDSISSTTGQPVYHPGTGLVTKNTFTERTFDVKREDKQFTYFVIANANFTIKADELKPYFKSSTTAITDSLDRWNIVKDLIVDTLYPTAASLPASITSMFGVIMPINTSLIIDTKKVSNGIVYVLSSSSTPFANKFLPVRVEGENPTGFLSDKTSNTSFLRVRRNPVTGANYSDILVSGHAVTGYYSFYRLPEMPSMKYNVYALAVNDFQTAAEFQSIIPVYYTPPPFTVSASTNGYIYIGNVTYPANTFTVLPSVSTQLPTNTTQLSYGVPLSTAAGAYNEVFLGTFTSNLFGTLDIRLTSAGTTLGSAGTAPIALDYFRLVPVP